MARKPAPTKAHPDAKSPKPATTDEHPALTLFHALNGLHRVCFNAHLFRDLAERRKQASEVKLNRESARAERASNRANELARTGATREQQWAAVVEGMDRANDPPPSNEPAEYATFLRETVLDDGRTCCKRARAAMRSGGAKGLDAATHPNAAGQPRSIELHTKLQDAERVFVGLTISVGDPRIIIDKDAASMADLGEWFARTRDELGAVLETRGLDVPPTTPAGDKGCAKPPALPAEADAIDEHDVALLAFLNRKPNVRRKVADVLPERGPQDRKAVAKRLRKLANRTPPLVDYPKDGRSGVAILPAGVEALTRATAPMPR